MQYQIIKKETGEVIAWIDTNQTSQVVHKDYDLVVGDNLTAVESFDDSMKIKVKFFDKDLYAGDDSLKKIGEKSDWIDLRARENIELEEGESALIPLGVAMQLPDGYEAHLVPRSSTFKKWGIIQTNSIGVVDCSYCGDDDMWRQCNGNVM